MPRPGLPPTPGSSTDMKGKDGTQDLASLHLAFELPPPAYQDPARISPTDTRRTSPPSSATYPVQAAETVKARRRSSAAAHARETSFALPPPPTRSRKIIQMKPRQSSTAEPPSPSTTPAKGKESTPRAGKGSAASKTAASTASSTQAASQNSSTHKDQQGKKKQPSATSAAGRKIARKTAHSLIERRRRSKMNEEFALLKSMIPACTGEMHKLAILQASIEYVRYLEDCVAQLKEQHEGGAGGHRSSQLPSIREFHPTFHDDDTMQDVDMDEPDAVSPTFTAQPDNLQARQPSTSPALHAQDAASRGRQQSYSSVSTDHRHYSYSASAAPSPALGPQGYAGSGVGSALTSPALNPQPDLDQEATAALLMLNTDRRGFNAVNARRAVSVRDLLTS